MAYRRQVPSVHRRQVRAEGRAIRTADRHYVRTEGRTMRRWPLYLLLLVPILTVYVLTLTGTLPTGREEFLGYLLGVLCLGATLVNVHAGLLLIIVAIGLSPEISVSNVSNIRYEDFMIPTVFGVWLMQHILGKRALVPTGLKAPILLYLLLAAASSVLHAGTSGLDLKTSLSVYFKYVEYMLLLVLTANLLWTERQVAVFLVVMLVASMLAALFGAYQRAAGLDAYGSRVTGPEGETSNIYGGYLIFHLLLAFGLFVTCRKPLIYVPLFLLMALLFYVTLRTMSRGSYIALATALILMGLLTDRRILVWILVFFTLGPLVFPKDVQERVGTIVHVLPGTGHEAPTSWTSKQSAWKSLAPEIVKHPLFGKGVGVYQLGWVDNEYIKVMVEVGFAGFCVWAWWIVKMLVIGWRGFQRGRAWWHKGLGLGYLCGLVGFLVHAIAATSLTAIRTMEILMVATGLTVAMTHILVTLPPPRAPRREGEPGPPEDAPRPVRLRRGVPARLA